MFNKIFSILMVAGLYGHSTYAQNLFKDYEDLFTTPLHYTCFQTAETMSMDGSMNEVSWKNAKWSEYFKDIEGTKKPSPHLATRYKLLWDKNNLYVAAELADPDIWSAFTNRDDLLYMENAFEIFIDPDNDTHNYFEFEINPLQTVFDLYLSTPYRDRGNMMKDWNIADLKTGVQLEGSLNDPSNRDKKWTVEFAIPFAELKHNNYVSPIPTDKSLWRVNFLRVQWDLEMVNGVYKKKLNPTTGEPLPEHNWSWSPHGLVNMHYPERFGYVLFTTAKAGSKEPVFKLPSSEELKKYLWLVYYKQADYFKKSGTYARSFSELNYPASDILLSGKKTLITLNSTGTEFLAVIEYDNEKWQIDHNGLVKNIK
jgi:Carbohydrate family 9 binding domain-like